MSGYITITASGRIITFNMGQWRSIVVAMERAIHSSKMDIVFLFVCLFWGVPSFNWQKKCLGAPVHSSTFIALLPKHLYSCFFSKATWAGHLHCLLCLECAMWNYFHLTLLLLQLSPASSVCVYLRTLAESPPPQLYRVLFSWLFTSMGPQQYTCQMWTRLDQQFSW